MPEPPLAAATPDLAARALSLAQGLIRCPSVTPTDAGALDLLGGELRGLGFEVRRYRFGDVDNLYARWGAKGGRNLCFAGHTDVVPVGDAGAWTVDPFAAVVREGWLIGRGAADMKAAIAAWVAAVADVLATTTPDGALSFLITGDEEGPAIHGTKPLLEAIHAEGERLSQCVVGEPTSEVRVGDTLKNGRRGSLNIRLTAHGKQGHAAYPEKSANPVPVLLTVLERLRSRRLDDGAPGFQPSNLEITSIDVGNPTHNVIPASATARLNIRFNTAHSGAALEAWVRETVASVVAPGVTVVADLRTTGEPFYCPPDAFTALTLAAVEAETGAAPVLSTSGGTSDARFIHRYCPVIELGLQNETAHKVDERVATADIAALARVYRRVLGAYFA
jgi:succinyl-diaminopimelate desuccinylase